MTSTTLRRCLPTLLSSAAASFSYSSSSTLLRRTPGFLALPLAAAAAAAARGGAVAAFTTTLPRRGLEEFFDPTRAPHEPVQVGRAWTADELRRKSFSDLHKLWYVLYKERNVLLTEEASCKRNRVTLPSPHRKTLVRKSMARIKLVLKERQLQQQQQQEQQQQQQGGQGQQLQQEQQKEQQS